MKKGISIYPGLDNTPAENMALIQSAARLGITRIFTSLQIPETDRTLFRQQLHELLKLANSLHMDVISDISPASLELLGMEEFSLPRLHQKGLRTLRLDDGFTAAQIAELSQNDCGISLQLNASVLNEAALKKLQQQGCRLDRLEALHNFFPRENTGLSEEFTLRKTRLLQSYGIKTGAFVPSFARPRSPLKAGLPTLELHRETSFSFAIRHLAAMGMDCIFIGDSLPAEEELAALAELDDSAVLLRPEWLPGLTALEGELCHQVFTARPDEARDVLRTVESRRLAAQMLKKQAQEKNHANNIFPSISPRQETGLPRPAGTITLDNQLYQRYQGELQITKTDLPPDRRINVLGQLPALEQSLLKYISPGRKFRFIWA